MKLWEIREILSDGREVLVSVGSLRYVKAETSDDALTIFRSRLTELHEASDNEIEIDLYLDLEEARVVAVNVPDTALVKPVAREVITSSSAFISTDGDGYQFMNANRALGWKPTPAWGTEGWDMGRWPEICVMTSDDFARPRALVYIEGDVEVSEFDTTIGRELYLDSVAEQFWRSGDADGPNDLAAYREGALPARYYGEPDATVAAAVATTHIAVQDILVPRVER